MPPKVKIDRKKLLARWAEKFPVLNFTKPVPLAIGVKREFMEAFPKMRKQDVHRFFAWWCNRGAYLYAVAGEKSVRYHLDGSESEPVSDEHRVIARQKLAEMRSEHELTTADATA